SLVLDPDPIRLGEPVTVQVEGFDADNDPVSYTFKWWKNFEPIYEGDEATFQTTGVARGDVLVVQAVPRDSEEIGKGMYSEPMGIGNRAPVITSVPPLAITDGRYRYRVQAKDPDDDPLTFALAQAPPGMTIDPGTGLVLWQITAQTTGSFPVRVAVEDGQGGQAYQEFTLNPLAPSPAAVPPS
ncbi:MAG: Ig domain-containing protein, partial [Nitrospirales bacterium]